MKRNLVALSALVVAIAFSAFTTSNLTLPRYYKFVGATTSTSDLANPRKWEDIGTPWSGVQVARGVSLLSVQANASTCMYMSGAHVDRRAGADRGRVLHADLMLAGGPASRHRRQADNTPFRAGRAPGSPGRLPAGNDRVPAAKIRVADNRRLPGKGSRQPEPDDDDPGHDRAS